jgi:hypothetical protein
MSTADERENDEDDEDYECEVEDIDCGTEIIDWLSYAADNYRFTADAADARSAAEERWVVAQCFQRGDEYAYEPLTDEMTLAEAQEYEEGMAGDDGELGALIAQAESTDDYQEREALVTEIGGLVRGQIARFVSAS